MLFLTLKVLVSLSVLMPIKWHGKAQDMLLCLNLGN